MSIHTLASRLIALPGFQSRLSLLTAESIAMQFSALRKASRFCNLSHDWPYLLQCASVMAQSQTQECEDASLRIAQHCITVRPSPILADAACVIFHVLTNGPSIRLAVDRKAVAADPSSRLPLMLRSAWLRRDLQASTRVGEDSELLLNRFQKLVWTAAEESRALSISAPTSAGKSFLLCRWLAEYLRLNETAFVVYVVPTRALIHQVENDLRLHFSESENLPKISVSSLPLPSSVKSGVANVLVLTQERLHLLLLSLPGTTRPSLVIVDEAHKVGDGARGILLNNVVDTIAAEAQTAKFMFASPLVSNPEILLRGRLGGTKRNVVSSNHITVNQNLLWASQVRFRPKEWMLEALIGGKMTELGHITLPYRPSPESKRLTMVANALGDPSGGNLIYADGAADAEKAAHQVWDLQADKAPVDSELLGLMELVKTVVHPAYALVNTLKKGVAFHYGNMPLLIRTEVERLFKSGHVKFLICTSTLVEGVNLPCKSIFVRGPHKGRGKPMTETDFWNLAGRAGRLGKEFQGNIICLDPRDSRVWESPPPVRRGTYPLQPAADQLSTEAERVLSYIASDMTTEAGDKKAEYDQLISYLITQSCAEGGLSRSSVCSGMSASQRLQFETAIRGVIASLSIPIEIVHRNPGISPFAMNRLFRYFQQAATPGKDLLPVAPESEDAVQAYNAIFFRINSYLAPVFAPEKRTFALAILVVNWMRGWSLRRLIDALVKYFVKQKRTYEMANVIRGVMQDVEQVARFVAPLYLSCYIDILKYHLEVSNQADLIPQVLDVNIWLEFGASQQTQLSMMGLGLSRTTAIAVSEYITDDRMMEGEVLEKLRELNLESLGMPAAIQREVRQLLGGDK